MSQTGIEEWSANTLESCEAPTAGPIRFEPCYQPGDDNIRERIESLWHQAASLSEDIVQMTYSEEVEAGDGLYQRSIQRIYHGKQKASRHLLVSVITHIICSLTIERLLAKRWGPIGEQHRPILEYMYERQLELNWDITERWRANLFTIMVQDYSVSETEIRIMAQEFITAVEKTLAVKLTAGFHYTTFLKLVQDALSLAKELKLTASKYEFYAAIEATDFDEHFMESVNFQDEALKKEIAFVVFPGVVRTTDLDELVLATPSVLYRPKVFLEPQLVQEAPTSDQAPPLGNDAIDKISPTVPYPGIDMDQTDIAKGYSSIIGKLRERCISFTARQLVVDEGLATDTQVYCCSSNLELSEILGCCSLVSNSVADFGYLKHKRSFLGMLSRLPNIDMYLVIRAQRYVSRESIISAQLIPDEINGCEDFLERFGDSYISELDKGVEFFAVYPIQLFASVDKRPQLLQLLSSLQDHDPKIVFNRSRSSLWSNLLEQNSLALDFHTFQTNIFEQEAKPRKVPGVLDTFEYAQKVIAETDPCPPVISLRYQCYEMLKDGSELFSNLSSVRKRLFGCDETSGSDENHLGLIQAAHHVRLQISCIEIILKIHKFWDSLWRDTELTRLFEVLKEQLKSIRSDTERLAKFMTSSIALISYDDKLITTPTRTKLLKRRPRLRVFFFTDPSDYIGFDPDLTKFVYLRASLMSLELSGVNHVQGLKARYGGAQWHYDSRRFGLIPDHMDLDSIVSIKLNIDEQITKMEVAKEYYERKTTILRKSMPTCDSLSFVRLTTSHNKSCCIGGERKGTRPEIFTYGPGRFVVRLIANADRSGQIIISIEPILGQFEASEWL